MSATSQCTLTIDLPSKSASVVGLVAVLEIVQVDLKGIGVAAPTDLELFLFLNGIELASCLSFVSDGSGGATGSLNLGTQQLSTVFANTNDPQGRLSVAAVVWDATNACELANDSLVIQQNPFTPGLTAPTVLPALVVP